jgi:hypothetical protein
MRDYFYKFPDSVAMHAALEPLGIMYLLEDSDSYNQIEIKIK